MPPSGINHGLSVFTHADAAAAAATTANRRLRWPFADDSTFPISNCFNDATSGGLTPDFSSGHEGIDFGCGVGPPVHAMYGGEVEAYTWMAELGGWAWIGRALVPERAQAVVSYKVKVEGGA